MSNPNKKIIFGDDAANVLTGANHAEIIFGHGGNDAISGWGGKDLTFGGLGNDVLNGGRGNDRLFGEAGNDTLVGERGNDHLLGGEGNDLLLGASGNDHLDGGAGADIFLVSKGGGVDRIENFTAEDKIDLGAFRFASAQEAIDAFEQKGPNAVLELGEGNKLVLTNTRVADLTAEQFDVSPYLVPTDADPATPEIDSKVSFVPVMTVGDRVGDYTMAGLPDGLGAFDNGDGTFTVLMNHEIAAADGAVHDHGFAGAFVSKLVIDKESLEVLEGSDLIQHAFEYDPATGGYAALDDAFNRFCSADLARESAFYNQATGLGYNGGRLFLNGEEGGTEGRAFAHIASGDEEGNSYELAWLGNLAYENVVANPGSGDKTVVAATDDGQNGQVYFYFGDKKATGSAIDRAGLTGGSLYGLQVAELDTLAANNNESDGTTLGGDFQSAFTLVNLGDVSALDGAALDATSETLGVTSFLRPEDGAWDTIDPNRFYFVTTDGFGRPSRLWAADFNDASDPSRGGTISMLLDGTEGQQMFDNMTVGRDGKLILSEDVGNQDHLGKVWEYVPSTDTLTQLAQHDSNRFAPGGDFFLTRDEESSGVIDISEILGSDTRNAYLIDVQAHFSLGGELVQGGQLLVMYQDQIA